jgi:hypothetical protein
MVAIHQLMHPSAADTLSTPGEGSSSLASHTKAEGATEIIYGTEAVIETVLHAISLIVAITQIGNNFGYLHRLHFSAWHYFCYAIY